MAASLLKVRIARTDRETSAMTKLSGLVCVHNEEAQIAECLSRLTFCDEIVVVADRCTDRTVQIARTLGAVIVEGAFPLEGLRKHAGIDACQGEWIFELDADELVDEALGDEILAAIAAGPQGGYFQVPVDNYIGDTLVRRGWGGSFGTSSVARLYRQGVKHWKAQRIHPGVTFTADQAGTLTQPIRHMVDVDMADTLDRLNRYTDQRARDLAESGQVKSLADDVFRGFRRFFKCYFGRQGRKEGDHGFLIALMAGLYPVLSNLKAREIMASRNRAPKAVAVEPAYVEYAPAPRYLEAA